jgi:Uma2 family endonuclease
MLLLDLPSVVHQRVRDRLSRALASYLADYDLADLVVTSPCIVAPRGIAAPRGTHHAQPDIVQPDIAVFPPRGLREVWDYCLPPWFVVEVVSADTAIADRVTKRRFYLELGVATYWVIDPDGARVDVWCQRDVEPRQVSGWLRWTAQSAWPPFEIHIGELTTL